MEINHNYQTLVDNMALDKYGYIEIQGYEGREPEKLLTIRAYESKNSQRHIAIYHLLEKQRESVKKAAAQHGIEFEELPDIETKSKVQNEFEGWMTRKKEKKMDQISHYEKAVEFAKELSYGVVRGYWRNEIAKPFDTFNLRRNEWRPHGEFNVGRDRLAKYMIERIGYGKRSGQSYTTKRGAVVHHRDDEAGDIDLMISAMVGIGMLKKVDGSSIYELTGEAFALLREPSWFEKYHSKMAFWVSIAAAILSIILMLKELGIIWQG